MINLRTTTEILLLTAAVLILFSCSEYLPRDNPRDPLSTVNEEDKTAPEIIENESYPLNNYFGIYPTQSVHLVFSKMMDRETVEQAFSLVNPDPVPCAAAWLNYDTEVWFDSGGPKVMSRLYTATLGVGAQDAQGNPFPEPFELNFRIIEPDGTPNSEFNFDGITVYRDVSNDMRAEDVVVDSKGRILVCGCIHNGSNFVMAVWRYTSDGDPDLTFSDDGIFTHDGYVSGSEDDCGYGIALDSTGRIIVAGYSYRDGSNPDMAIWCLNEGGALDPSFDDGETDGETDGAGFIVHNDAAGGASEDYAYCLGVDNNDRIIAAGYSEDSSGYSLPTVWRYTNAGMSDGSFNSAGYAIRNFSFDSGSFYGMTVGSDDRIYLTGYVYDGSRKDAVVCCYDEDGTIDSTFSGSDGTSGFLTVDGFADGTDNDNGWALASDMDGNLFVVGDSTNDSSTFMFVLKLNADGAIETSFGNLDSDGVDGISTFTNTAGSGAIDGAFDIIINDAGKLQIIGYSNNGIDKDMAIWKINPYSGSLDSSFDGNGSVVSHNAAGGAGNDKGTAITIDNAGRILAAGYSSNGTNDDIVIWRYE